MKREKNPGEKNKYDVIRYILRDYASRENPITRKKIEDTAKKMGCNKVAYAHHRDDMIETMLMSLIYEGRFHCFNPVTYLDRMGLNVIRPMMYVPEMDVIGFANKYNLPVAKNPCPVDGHTKREYIKTLVRQLNRENPNCKDRLFTAVLNGGFD